MLAGRYAAAAVALALLLLSPPAAVSMDPICDKNFYTANGTFQANLNSLAAVLAANASASPAGFATASVGTLPDQANGLALCRGDTNASTCAACLAAAFQNAQQACPLDKGVTAIEDACVLRFAGTQFLDFLRPDQWIVSEIVPASSTSIGSVNASDAWYTAAVKTIYTALIDSAVAATNSTRKYFATAEMAFNPKIYGLAQCTPNLTPDQCRGCLGLIQNVTLAQQMSGRPLSNEGGVAWCLLKYSVVSPVYEGRAMLQLAAPPEPAPTLSPATPESVTGTTVANLSFLLNKQFLQSYRNSSQCSNFKVVIRQIHGWVYIYAGRKQISAGIVAGIAGSVAFIFTISVFVFLRFRRMIKARKNKHPPTKIGNAQYMAFDLATLQEATENFSEKNKLGEGGFGTVYKGILSDGQEIAVKTLLGRTGHALDQLHNEVQVLAQLQHKNLVRLLGFCSHQDDTLLVYEYIKNGSLDNFLFDKSKGNALHWELQYNIIIGIAKGILYLHEDSSMRIIHRDLKANNILLSDDMEPKIADFGLAKLLVEGHTRTQTARAVGTLGYMAPEYAMHGRVSPKIDIFSFGVLVLEIVTRRSNCSSDDYSAVNLLSDLCRGEEKKRGAPPVPAGRLVMLAGRYAAAAVALALLLLSPPAAVSMDPICDKNFYTANGTFQANLNSLAAVLAANASASPAGFATATVGTLPDQANGLALCRGDTNASNCAACLASAFQNAQQSCPLDKGVTAIEDACLLRFAGRQFLDFLNQTQWVVSELVPTVESTFGSVNASEDWFTAAVNVTYSALIDSAAAATNSTRKYFATAEMAFNPKIYGFAQCTPDLTPVQCQSCLGMFRDETMARHMGGRPSSNYAGAVWCILRYSVSPFYEGRAMLQLAAPPEPAPTISPATPESRTGSTLLGEKGIAGIAAGIAGSVVSILILSVFLFLRFRSRRRRIKATDNDHRALDETDVETSLIIPNKSTGNTLQWEQQYNIILGIAKGILYLHEDSTMRIIHRDLKASNILLDDDMEPKIADFGLARLLTEGHTRSQTTKRVGTLGYMPPEYAMQGRVSPKIDIFSFGVLILEIVTRRSNCSYNDHSTVNLLSDVWRHTTSGSVSQMLDQSLDEYGRNQALRCIHVGLLCVQVHPDDRPDISTVVFMLTRDGMELPPPEKPAFCFTGESPTRIDRSSFISEQDISLNGLTFTEPYPR
ncbi:hypothetical protein PR202_ga29689 [Eleusine coracana subsp. coracana]|uniref:Uncharacterized protein n=1 Tax=Eleusine coracana subsp. coracana TaxID=191504 RepID=A0AAV5DM30_ELECO|nr:hypothetical protein PR202_ga29689 [Eleusine coracana subsp. coracana]